jgi:glycosyltransferase involved in cell wall biosynthesis
MTQNNKSPLVSVIMSVYNDWHYLDNALTSILDQTYINFEFIIFDDCSSDGSREKLIEYAAKDQRIELILNDKNKGLTKNLNEGLKRSKGKFIARMDSDDYSFPERFEKQVNALNSSPELVLVGTSYYTIDDKGSRYKLDVAYQCDQTTFWIALFMPPLMHPSAMFRRSLITDNDILYNEAYVTAQDFDMWSQMLRVGECKVLPEPLIEYRLHSNNISATKKESQKLNASIIAHENLIHHFPEFAKSHSQPLKDLCTFLYLDKPLLLTEIKRAVNMMTTLHQQYINSHSLNYRQQIKLKMLATRWLVKGIVCKRPSTLCTKLFKWFCLYRYIDAIFLETISYCKRRLIS